MDKQIKIALVGKKKTGRTFIARYIWKNYKVKKWALNDGVNRVYRMLYDYHQYQRFPWERVRETYDYFYGVDPDIWVKFLERRYTHSNYDIIIDDVRYVNEVKYLKERGFIIVRVTAPDTVRNVRVAKQLGKSAHAGTTVIYEYFNRDNTAGYQADYVIHNDTKDNTRAAADDLMVLLGAERRKKLTQDT